MNTTGPVGKRVRPGDTAISYALAEGAAILLGEAPREVLRLVAR